MKLQDHCAKFGHGVGWQVGSWLATMDGDGNLRGSSREEQEGSPMLGGLHRPQPRVLTDAAAQARQHGCSQTYY